MYIVEFMDQHEYQSQRLALDQMAPLTTPETDGMFPIFYKFF